MPNIVTLKSFPFDSMQILNEESGQMEEDRVYDAEIFRKYFAKFLSNGVYYGHYNNYGENGMKVIVDSGLTIKVKSGCGIVNGADFELEDDTLFVLDRPENGNRVDRVVVKVDDTLATRKTQLYIKAGEGIIPAELERNENIYEICVAEVIVKSTTNITQSDITDTRLDKTLCGIVNSLISIDGEELYQNFQSYIDTVVNELVRKDEEDIVFSGTIHDSIGGTSENNFTNTYKNKLDEVTQIQSKIRYGTSIPSNLEEGEIYLQYFN